MNRSAWKPLAAIAVLAAFGSAHAQMRHRPPEPQDFGRAPFQQLQGAAAPREAQRQEFAPPGRLSPEERRQLRRDIHEAGRELYQRHPQRPQP